MDVQWEELTANQKVVLFLDTYRRLETVGEKLLGRGSRGSVLLNLARLKQFRKYAEELDCCREVRNLLSHEIMVNGEYPAVPSRGMQDLLEMMIRRIEKPDTVEDRMTPRNRLVEASGNQTVAAVMESMQRNGISHLPLLKNNRVCGMFSAVLVLEAVLSGYTISKETRIEELESQLIRGMKPGSYPFVARTMTVEDAEELVEKASRRRKVRLLLVTENGDPQEKLLGVVSPSDLLN